MTLFLGIPAQAATLTVYTYDSFAAEWGPGPKIESMFEAECGCDLEFVGLEDAVAILSRIRFEGAASKADVVVGLDTSLAREAAESGLFSPHEVDLTGIDVPGGYADPLFVPFDYGYFAFVYDTTRLATPPVSLKDLVETSDASILIQDPRTSSPGLGLVLWMRHVFGEQAGAAWEKLSERIVTVTPGWSEAYGLFQKGEADMVLSYTTSPAYHVEAENDTRYKAAAFAEGHYRQVEIAGRLSAAPNGALASQFLQFLVSPQAQAILPATQWMYPVRDVGAAMPKAFGELVDVATPLSFTPQEVAAGREAWVKQWLGALSR